MSITSDLAAIADEQFVSLTTFRRSGAAVATRVWIARDGDALVVTTPLDTGKVKRLHHEPRVELRPCSRRGTVPEGVEPVNGVAEVLPGTLRRAPSPPCGPSTASPSGSCRSSNGWCADAGRPAES